MPTPFLAKLLLLTLAFTAPLTGAYAELIDNSKSVVITEEQAKDYNAQTFVFAASDASWKVKPIISIPERVKVRSKLGTRYDVVLKLLVDKQGDIVEVMLMKSSGNRRLDASAINSVQKAKLKPFMKNGQAVTAQVVLPIRYIIQ